MALLVHHYMVIMGAEAVYGLWSGCSEDRLHFLFATPTQPGYLLLSLLLWGIFLANDHCNILIFPSRASWVQAVHCGS